MIRKLLQVLIILFVLGTGDHLYAQLVVTQGAAMNMTPLDLVAQQLVGQGVTVSNATFNGSSALISSTQLGYFTATGSTYTELGFTAGVLLTNGMASNAVGPNNNCAKGTGTGTGDDLDLHNLANALTIDKCVLEFDFVPQADTLKFRYEFASEEFYNYCANIYNDVFGFFLSGPGITGTFSNNSVNIALMPITGNYVGINNICNDPSCAWCNKPLDCHTGNPPAYTNCAIPHGQGINLQYNGFSIILTAWHIVVPCSTYHIKLAIADVGDGGLDSGVFLEKNSFSATGLQVNNTYAMPLLHQGAIEGCSDAIVSFILAQPTVTPYTVHYTVGGTAIMGVDYAAIPDSVVIPAGSDSNSVAIHAFLDGIPEGIETVVFHVEVPSCFGSSYFDDTVRIYDNTYLNATATPDTGNCVGTIVTLKAYPTGGQTPYSYLWSTGATTRTITFTPPLGVQSYSVVVFDACNQSDTAYMTVTTTGLPNITNNPLSSGICNSTNTGISLTSDVTGATFTWTANGSTLNVSGYSAGSGPSISQVLTNTGTNVETVTYHITAHMSSCAGPVSNFVVTVYPTPDLSTIPLNKQICSGQSTNINLTSNITGTQFTWTCTPSSGNVTGYSDNSVPTTQINQTLLVSPWSSETVTYHITPLVNSCPGTITPYTVTINPGPHLTNNPVYDSICTEFTTNINLTASAPLTTFTWTAALISGNITGFSGGSGSLIAQTLINSLPITGEVDYTISMTAVGCLGIDTTYKVFVKPKPHLTNNPLSKSICSGASTNINLIPDVTGTLFTWTCTSGSANIIGFSDNLIIPSTLINQTLINTGFNTETVTYHITPHALGCTGLLSDFIVTVYPVPDVYFTPPAQTICSQQTTNVQVLSHVSGATFTWTVTASSINLSGFSNGSANIISQTLVNSGTTIETVTYHVTPSANGCPPGTTQNIVITVNPKPLINTTPTTYQICDNTSVNITLQSSVPGTTFSWTATGTTNVTGYSAGSGPAIIQTLDNTAFTNQTVTYAVTPLANTCNGPVTNFIVTVFPTPDVYFNPLAQTLCSGQTTGIQNLSHIAGTTFFWTVSVSSGNVSGASAGNGSNIQQTLTNIGYTAELVNYLVNPTANSCPGVSNNVIITLHPVPSLTFINCFDPVTTTDAKSFNLKGGNPLGGAYSGAGITAGIFYPSLAGTGAHTLTYSYTNMFGCTKTATSPVTVLLPVSILCGNTLTDVRDNKQYGTVKIGSQCWLSANLNYGTDIASSAMQRDDCEPQKYCFQDIPANCTQSGGLYQWDEMMQYSSLAGSQGLCPPAWHVPTESDWNILFNFYISNGFAGSPLKYDGYSGFNAFLSGTRFENTNWYFNNFAVMLWSSSVQGTEKAWAHGMNSFVPSVSFYPSLRSNAFPVRCIKD